MHGDTMTRLENNQMSCTTTVMPTLFIFSYVLGLFLLWALSWKTKWSLSHRLFHLYHKPKIMLAWNYFFLFLFKKFFWLLYRQNKVNEKQASKSISCSTLSLQLMLTCCLSIRYQCNFSGVVYLKYSTTLQVAMESNLASWLIIVLFTEL